MNSLLSVPQQSYHATPEVVRGSERNSHLKLAAALGAAVGTVAFLSVSFGTSNAQFLKVSTPVSRPSLQTRTVPAAASQRVPVHSRLVEAPAYSAPAAYASVSGTTLDSDATAVRQVLPTSIPDPAGGLQEPPHGH